jgi:hypothetical protein
LQAFVNYDHKKFYNIGARMMFIEQTADSPFNKGLLMNVGAKEASKLVLDALAKENNTFASKSLLKICLHVQQIRFKFAAKCSL